MSWHRFDRFHRDEQLKRHGHAPRRSRAEYIVMAVLLVVTLLVLGWLAHRHHETPKCPPDFLGQTVPADCRPEQR